MSAMNATVFYMHHADGSAEPMIAKGAARADVAAELGALGIGVGSEVYRTADGGAAGPWLRSRPEGEEPVSEGEVPGSVKTAAQVVGAWRPTHALAHGGQLRYVLAPADGQDGPAPSLREWLSGAGDGAPYSRRGGVWYYFGTPYEGPVASARARASIVPPSAGPASASAETPTMPEAGRTAAEVQRVRDAAKAKGQAPGAVR